VLSGASFTANSILAGTGGLTKTGAGTLLLRGTNTFTKSGTGSQAFLTISGGVVDFVTDLNLGALPSATNNTGALTIDGGTLRYSGSTNYTWANKRGITIGSSGGGIEVPINVELTIPDTTPSTTIQGPGTLTKSGGGRLALTAGQLDFTGKVVINAGSIGFTFDSVFGIAPVTVQSDYFTLNGGALRVSVLTLRSINSNRGMILGAGGGMLVGPGAGISYDGVISGTQGGKLTIALHDGAVSDSNSSGVVALGGASTYDGPTQVESGMQLTATLLKNGGVASSIGQSSSAAANLILNGGKLTYTGPATSTDRTFTLTTFGGEIDASGSAISFTSTNPIGFIGTVSRTLTLGGTSTDDNAMSPAIIDASFGSTSIAKVGAGTWVLSNANNSYTGDTSVSGGRLKLGASGAIPDASRIVMNSSSAIFDLNGYDETVRTLFGSTGTVALGPNTLTIGGAVAESFTGPITGTGGGKIIKNGTGRIAFGSAASTFDGGVVINAGGIGIGASAALGTGPIVINNSALLSASVGTTVTPTNAVTLNGNLTFDTFFSGGPIVWGSSGTNQWTITGGNRTITVTRPSGPYTITINQVIGEDVAGRGLTKAGNATLTLGGMNTYTGDTTVQAGTLNISNPYLADGADVLLTTRAKLNLNFSGSDSIDSLLIDGMAQALGTWGAVGSGAAHESSLIGGSGWLQVTHTIPGDFNGNGRVDAADYTAWRKIENTSSALPNDNGLGVPIGQSHYVLWRENFGVGAASSSGLGEAAVPEPTTLILATIVAILFGSRRRWLRD
jgi:autotransporter-associated beta strand protein